MSSTFRWVAESQCLFLFLRFIYVKFRVIQEEKIFRKLVHFPDGRNSQRQEEARSFFCVSYASAGAQALGAPAAAFPGVLVGDCVGSRAAGVWTDAHTGCQCCNHRLHPCASAGARAAAF